MARLLLTAILVTSLLIPASAEAHGRQSHHHASSKAHRQASAQQLALDKLAGHGPVVLATAVAESYWNAVPCGGQITVLTNLPVPSSLEPSTDGWVTFDSSLGENDLEAPASTYTQCTISLARWQWPTRKSMKQDWNMFCLTITHEVGHLLGHKHTLIPGSVMAPVFINESNVPPVCRAQRLSGEAAVSRSPKR
jgi:Matrixin